MATKQPTKSHTVRFPADLHLEAMSLTRLTDEAPSFNELVVAGLEDLISRLRANPEIDKAVQEAIDRHAQTQQLSTVLTRSFEERNVAETERDPKAAEGPTP